MELMMEKQLNRMALADMLKVKREQIDVWLLSSESKSMKKFLIWQLNYSN